MRLYRSFLTGRILVCLFNLLLQLHVISDVPQALPFTPADFDEPQTKVEVSS